MSGRVALVTGGGRGIGREAALLLSAAGARVMIVARTASELAGVGLEYVAADLGTREGCALAVAETERRLGPIGVLVVNHGIDPHPRGPCRQRRRGREHRAQGRGSKRSGGKSHALRLRKVWARRHDAPGVG